MTPNSDAAKDIGVYMSGGALPNYLLESLQVGDVKHSNPSRYMQLEVDKIIPSLTLSLTLN